MMEAERPPLSLRHGRRRSQEGPTRLEPLQARTAPAFLRAPPPGNSPSISAIDLGAGNDDADRACGEASNDRPEGLGGTRCDAVRRHHDWAWRARPERRTHRW